ncbi:MAG TPA: DUF969 domain-containing protein [Caulobacteraceae bacterium]
MLEYLVLAGIALVVGGFLLRLNPLLVVVTGALATGVLGAIAHGAPLTPSALFAALIATLKTLGKAYNNNRIITLIWTILPLIGLLEREGLQERARHLIGRIGAATVGGILLTYFLIRQITSALGLTSMMGQAQTVRPLLAPMTEAALEKEFGPAPDKMRERVRAWSAAADNIAVFYGEDIFIAIGAVLLIVGTMKGFGVNAPPLAISLWAIPTAICALVIHGARLLTFDRSLKRQMGQDT